MQEVELTLAQQYKPDMEHLKKTLFQEYTAPSGMKVVLRRLPVEMLDKVLSFYEKYVDLLEKEKKKEEASKPKTPKRPAHQRSRPGQAVQAVETKPKIKEISDKEVAEKAVTPEVAQELVRMIKLVLPMAMVSPVIGRDIEFIDISMDDGPEIFWKIMDFSGMTPERIAQDKKTVGDGDSNRSDKDSGEVREKSK